MASTPKLPSDFVGLLAAFADAEVRYLVIGGYAVGFHDRPRATTDLDLLLADDSDNVERACQALGSFGAASETIDALRRSANDEVVWFGVPPVRVDLLKSVVGLDDLVRMKKAADRDQDRADVRRLERHQQKSK